MELQLPLLRTGEGGPPSLILFFFLKGTENGWDKMWDMLEGFCTCEFRGFCMTVPPKTSGWKIHVCFCCLRKKVHHQTGRILAA